MLQTVLCGAACAAAAYLLGSLSFSIIVTRLLYHKDIRTFGSGNAGMTNVCLLYTSHPDRGCPASARRPGRPPRCRSCLQGCLR